jgi:hypothetical protein
MKITKSKLKRIIQEELQVLTEQPGGDPGIAAYYKNKEIERKAAYEKFIQALEKYEALPAGSPEKLTMKQEVDTLKRAYHSAGYVGD